MTILGSTNAQFNISLARPVEEVVRIAWRTVEVSAKAGIDFEQSSGELVFAPGETEKSVYVLIYPSTTANGKTFRLMLDRPSNAILASTHVPEATIGVDAAGRLPTVNVTVATGPKGRTVGEMRADEVPPIAPVSGDRWLNPSTGTEYTWTVTSSGGQWVEYFPGAVGDGALQPFLDEIRSVIRTPSDEPPMATLPAASERANKVMGFGPIGQPSVFIPASGSAADVMIQLAQSSGASKVAFGGRTVADKLSDVVSVRDFGAIGDGMADDTAAVQACFDYCRDQGISWSIPRGDFFVTSVVAYTGGDCSGRLVAENIPDGPAVFTLASMPEDVETMSVSHIVNWGDFKPGRSVIPAATGLDGYYYTVVTPLKWIVRSSGGGTFNKHHTFRFVSDVGDITPPARVAFDIADVVGVTRRRIRDCVSVNGLRVEFRGGLGPRQGAVRVERPNSLFTGCSVSNESGSPIHIGFATHTTCMATFVNCYVDGARVLDTNYGFGAGSWSFDLTYINCRESYCRRGLDSQMGQDVNVIGGAFPSGIGGHWVHGLRVSAGTIIGTSESNANPIHVAGGDIHISDCTLVARSGRGGGGFVNMREDLPELSGAVILRDNTYILDDQAGLFSEWSILDISFGSVTGYQPGRRHYLPSQIRISGGEFKLNRGVGDAATPFRLYAVKQGWADTEAKCTHGAIIEGTVEIEALRTDFGVIGDLVNGAEPRLAMLYNKSLDMSGNGYAARISALPAFLLFASSVAANVDTEAKRLAARLDMVCREVPRVRASIADGVTRRVLVENCDEFTRSKPGGTTGFVAVGDEIFGNSAANFTFPGYSKTSLPTPAYGRVIFVGNDVGGATLAYADGSAWRRVADRAVIA